ncbi:MAG: peroxiredoxin [Rhodobacteraceae bacterium]|nr:peroxiredoxin [Paracoccaceae bacterium]
MIDIGDKLPDFELPRDGGNMVKLSDFTGKTLVLFLYPKDDTSGCTKESIEFTEKKALFDAEGAVIVGLSKDSVKSHDKFVVKHDLGVMLISDESCKLVEALGAWVEKSMYGRKYMGIERTTLLVDSTGVIRNLWRKVKVPGHVDAVLEAVKTL